MEKTSMYKTIFGNLKIL